METFNNGAVRSEKKPRYFDLGTGIFIRGGRAMAEGHEKYEKNLPPGHKNFQKGDTEFAIEAFNHLFEHVLLYRDQLLDRLHGRTPVEDEDHLGHAVANLVMLDYYETHGLFDYMAPEDEEALDAADVLLSQSEEYGPFTPEELEKITLPTDEEIEADTIVQKIMSVFGGKR